ncbi:phenylacetate--CoA ligase family protein [Roseibium denhamense]|uniref:Phenylacetate-CoA ligase n=1 Tax=Roseibium denhamense TaxID=76305 RepID=A0ABY1NLN9_9HYPH|nr:AMP-binding protein [Roseibium denhamense]MTI06853.1 phenylacetate--CoA ligase family protein [Roseibium denhamense]SMP12045.1 phenylacetate-CoA ligase [Roseibium denhamense]
MGEMQFDARERQDPAQREQDLFAKLPEFLGHAVSKAPGWAEYLQGCDLAGVTDRSALARLPVLRKSELMEKQKARPPFGGFLAGDLSGASRVFMSPGPIWEPQAPGLDPWNGARSLFAAGFRAGDVVLNAFSYHLTPGGFILDQGAIALGCTVFPAGVGNTDMQIEVIETLEPVGFVGTPDYLKVLLDRAKDQGRDVSSITKALVSGGALFPSLRQEYEGQGIKVAQCYATADLGVIAYETGADTGMVVNEDYIVEIVRPGTGEAVSDGEVGELVVTCFNPTYPLIRFGTGDLSKIVPGQSPCGRTNMRLAGWMGRADQRTKIKGMFVDPKQVAEIVSAHPEVSKARLAVRRDGESDVMTLSVETASAENGLGDRVASTLRDITRLKGAVELVAPGGLPNDGKVISDERDYG